jgi:hypothetical protein
LIEELSEEQRKKVQALYKKLEEENAANAKKVKDLQTTVLFLNFFLF